MRFTLLAAGVFCLCLTSFGLAQGPAPAPQPVVSDYRLGPEDVIQVTVYKECPDFCVDHMVVRPDGKVTVPLIGEILAAGKTTPQLEKEITGALVECCLDVPPRVSVAVKEMNSSKVAILGEVKKPDRYKILPQTTLLEVIAMAGGFTDFAKKKEVTVRRGGEAPLKVNVEKLWNSKSAPFYVMPNDTIYVP